MATILIDPITNSPVDATGRPIQAPPVGPDDTIEMYQDPDIGRVDVPPAYTRGQGAQEFQALTQDKPFSFGNALGAGLTLPLRAIAGLTEEFKGLAGVPTLEDTVAQSRGQLGGDPNVGIGDRFLGMITGRTRDEETAAHTVRQRFLQNLDERKRAIESNKASLDLRLSGYQIEKIQPEIERSQLKLQTERLFGLPTAAAKLGQSQAATSASRAREASAYANIDKTRLGIQDLTERRARAAAARQKLQGGVKIEDLSPQEVADLVFDISGGDPEMASSVAGTLKSLSTMPTGPTGQTTGQQTTGARTDIAKLEEQIAGMIDDRQRLLEGRVKEWDKQFVFQRRGADPNKELEGLTTLQGDILSAVKTGAITDSQALAAASGKKPLSQFTDVGSLESRLPAQVTAQGRYGGGSTAATAPQAATPEPADMAAARADLTKEWTEKVGPIDKPNASGVGFEDFLAKKYYPQWKARPK